MNTLEAVDLSATFTADPDTPLWNELLDEHGADRLAELATGWPDLQSSAPGGDPEADPYENDLPEPGETGDPGSTEAEPVAPAEEPAVAPEPAEVDPSTENASDAG